MLAKEEWHQPNSVEQFKYAEEKKHTSWNNAQRAQLYRYKASLWEKLGWTEPATRASEMKPGH